MGRHHRRSYAVCALLSSAMAGRKSGPDICEDRMEICGTLRSKDLAMNQVAGAVACWTLLRHGSPLQGQGEYFRGKASEAWPTAPWWVGWTTATVGCMWGVYRAGW